MELVRLVGGQGRGGNFLDMWDQIPTNKVVGALWENSADGEAFASGLPGLFEEMGWTLGDPGRYQPGTEDYTPIISQFKKDGVEVVCGMASPPDFANFWNQAVQQSFKPPIATVAKALLFPDGVNALGELGDGMTVEAWYHPTFPFKSDVTGMTPQQYCDAYEADTGQQWTQPVCFIGCFELWTDILRRAKDPMDKNSIVEAIKGTKIMATGGPVDWTVNPEPNMGYWNFCTKPIAGGQWVKGTGKWPYDWNIVASVSQPDIKTTALDQRAGLTRPSLPSSLEEGDARRREAPERMPDLPSRAATSGSPGPGWQQPQRFSRRAVIRASRTASCR